MLEDISVINKDVSRGTPIPTYSRQIKENLMSSKNIYIPTPCQILEQMSWDYDPPTEEELREGSSTTNFGFPQFGEDNGMWGRKQSDKQKKAVSKVMKGKKKWYKIKSNWPTMNGSDNPRARRVYAEGKEYDTIRECCEAYGFKNHNAIRYRLNHDKWTEWYYV